MSFGVSTHPLGATAAGRRWAWQFMPCPSLSVLPTPGRCRLLIGRSRSAAGSSGRAPAHRCFEPADLAVTARDGSGHAPLPPPPASPPKPSPCPPFFSIPRLALCTVALLSCTRSPPRHQPPRQVCPRRSRCSRRPAPPPPPRDGASLGPSAGTSFRPGSAASAPPGERMR